MCQTHTHRGDPALDVLVGDDAQRHLALLDTRADLALLAWPSARVLSFC